MKRLFTPQWQDPIPVKIPQELRQAVPASDLLLQTLVNRGYSDPQSAQAFLDPNLYSPASPLELPDLDKAVLRIQAALQNQECIGVWGDFDVDGQTSTTVLVSTFRHLGAQILYHIPIRKTESHGILIEPLKAFLNLGVRLLITCDTGISANEAVQYAQSRGIDVIITDHHSLPPELPSAFAAINPQRLPEKHPLRSLSGVGVAYELVLELCNRRGDNGFPPTLLDLVAMGLIADVATLTADTRYLVQRGLAHLQNTTRPAISKIFAENQVDSNQVNEETISFVVAPRMNAVGRLSDANPMVEFLLSEDPVFIATTYNQIEGLNADRKIRCDQVYKGAQAQLEANPRLLERPLIMLSHSEWDSGVVGIVASRLVEQYHLPVILLNSSDPLLAKGSCRSVEGINITEALRQNSSLLQTFGGHPMAAGLSVRNEDLAALQFGIIASINRMFAAHLLEPVLTIDAYVDLQIIDLDLLYDLSRLAPFGPGNPPLHFAAKNLSIDSISQMGKTKEHLLVNLQSSQGSNFRFVWWQGAGMPQPEGNFDLLFHTRVNNYKGNEEVQFEWEDFRNSAEQNVATRNLRNKKTSIDNIDLRTCVDSSQKLIALASQNPLLVWNEGISPCPIDAYNRWQLKPAKYLVIWSIPPSPLILRQAIEQSNPERIYWFGLVPPENDLGTLLRQAVRIIKSDLSSSRDDHTLPLADLAANLAATIPLVTLILKWLGASGEITINKMDGENALINTQKSQPDPITVALLQKELTILQKETTAYRQFYLSAAAVDSLIS
jgi:single-stranded-DNA-specific exonuclease